MHVIWFTTSSQYHQLDENPVYMIQLLFDVVGLSFDASGPGNKQFFFTVAKHFSQIGRDFSLRLVIAESHVVVSWNTLYRPMPALVFGQ